MRLGGKTGAPEHSLLISADRLNLLKTNTYGWSIYLAKIGRCKRLFQ
jgi:hypothetical protein